MSPALAAAEERRRRSTCTEVDKSERSVVISVIDSDEQACAGAQNAHRTTTRTYRLPNAPNASVAARLGVLVPLLSRRSSEMASRAAWDATWRVTGAARPNRQRQYRPHLTMLNTCGSAVC